MHGPRSGCFSTVAHCEGLGVFWRVGACGGPVLRGVVFGMSFASTRRCATQFVLFVFTHRSILSFFRRRRTARVLVRGCVERNTSTFLIAMCAAFILLYYCCVVALGFCTTVLYGSVEHQMEPGVSRKGQGEGIVPGRSVCRCRKEGGRAQPLLGGKTAPITHRMAGQGHG